MYCNWGNGNTERRDKLDVPRGINHVKGILDSVTAPRRCHNTTNGIQAFLDGVDDDEETLV